MGFVNMVTDGLRNVVANLGTARDKSAGSAYEFSPLTDQQLVASYRGAWLPRKLVDIPALDSTRRWRAWNAEKEQITALEAEEKRLNIQRKTLQALTAARLYGGAALFIGTGDENLEEPLPIERLGLGDLKYLTVLTKNDLNADQLNNDPTTEWFNRPERYQLSSSRARMTWIHASRLVLFNGAEPPEDEMDTTRGWGDSVLQSIMQAVLQADSTSSNIASLVFEAKVDVIKIPGLMEGLRDSAYERRLLERFTLAATGKGINGALILDADEDYSQKSASFATLPDIMDRFYQNVSGAADIPMTRLFGRAPAGMNSTGESDLRNYYDRIQSHQHLSITPVMNRLDEALIRSALGARPPEVTYDWRSLWQTTDKERAEIGKITAETIKTLKEAEVMPMETLGSAAINAMIEGGHLSGLESAVEEFGSDIMNDVPNDLTAVPPQLEQRPNTQEVDPNEQQPNV